jgi:hypothetical protein
VPPSDANTKGRLPDGTVRLVEPEFAGRLSGFTLLYEALLLMLAQQMPFAAVARLTGDSPHRVLAVRRRYVELALEGADYSTVKALAIDETSRARGHDYITLAADAQQQAAKRRARGFVRLSTIRTVLFLIASKLNFQTVNPHAS